MIHVVIAEASLELIPRSISTHPEIIADSRRRKKEPSSILLDKTFHYHAMSKLENKEKRGRPDLVHFAVNSVVSSPLYMKNRIKLHIHTINNKLVEIKGGTRLPKHYLRFRGLFEKLLAEGNAGKLLTLKEGSIKDLVHSVSPDWVVGLSSNAKFCELEILAKRIVNKNEPFIVVGGFPHGDFSKETIEVINEFYRIHDFSLESHTVLSWLTYELEKNQSLKAQ